MSTKYKILIISDTHTKHKELEKKFDLPEADFLIHCGDITGYGSERSTRDFLKWFGGLKQFPNKIFIAGNHDSFFENYGQWARQLVNEYAKKYAANGDIWYLEDMGIELNGLKFWGSPVTRPFMNWAFNRPELKLASHWEIIPKDIDILITHGAPEEILDFSYTGSQEHTGSPSLRNEVETRIKPLIHCFGHIHEQYGQKEINGIKFVNASSLNEMYEMVNPPILIEIEK